MKWEISKPNLIVPFFFLLSLSLIRWGCFFFFRGWFCLLEMVEDQDYKTQTWWWWRGGGDYSFLITEILLPTFFIHRVSSRFSSSFLSFLSSSSSESKSLSNPNPKHLIPDHLFLPSSQYRTVANSLRVKSPIVWSSTFTSTTVHSLKVTSILSHTLPLPFFY